MSRRLTLALPFFVASGAVWLGLEAAFGQPILIVVGLSCLAAVCYGVWGSRRVAPSDVSEEPQP